MKSIFVVLIILTALSCNTSPADKTKNNTINITVPDSSWTDTTYYKGEKLYEVISMNADKRHGSYTSYMLDKDTFLFGQYSNNLREGRWMLKHYNKRINDRDNPLKGTEYSYIPRDEVEFILWDVKVYFDFENDSIKHIKEYRWDKKTKNLQWDADINFGEDTLYKMKTWYPNGIQSQITSSINGGLVHDTTWKWREDGTLYYMSVRERGKTLSTIEYDKTGTKVIKEEKGN
jgi:antitoxin component YwqK of YwqJK toxin-antitoxin module